MWQAQYGTLTLEEIMKVGNYSHVVHISSAHTGKLRGGLTPWDALRAGATLPAGTISAAHKFRAMQTNDELESTKREPYGGGIGYISLHDAMNMALALRTMVVPNRLKLRRGKVGVTMFCAGGG